MRRSKHRHPVAVLREKCGKLQKEFADLIGCSRVYLQKIEQTPAYGGEPLSAKLAQRIFHETGVSLAWLRAGDPKAPPVSSRGEPYTKEIYDRAQIEKIYYDRPLPFFQYTDALNVCARLAGILQSASNGKKYYVAMYKLGGVLSELETEFGQEPGLESINKQMDLLKPVVAHGAALLKGGKGIQELYAPTKPKKQRLLTKAKRRRS